MTTRQLYCDGNSPKWPTNRPFIRNNTGTPGLGTFLKEIKENCPEEDFAIACQERKFAVRSGPVCKKFQKLFKSVALHQFVYLSVLFFFFL